MFFDCEMRANTADETTKGRERAAENKEAKNVRIADSDLAVAVQLPRVGLGAHVTIVRITKKYKCIIATKSFVVDVRPDALFNT